MDTIFINSENGRTLKPHILALKLVNKLDLRFGEKVIALSIKYLLEHRMMNLNYLMDLILYQIYKIILSIFKKNMVKILINHQYRYM